MCLLKHKRHVGRNSTYLNVGGHCVINYLVNELVAGSGILKCMSMSTIHAPIGMQFDQDMCPKGMDIDVERANLKNSIIVKYSP